MFLHGSLYHQLPAFSVNLIFMTLNRFHGFSVFIRCAHVLSVVMDFRRVQMRAALILAVTASHPRPIKHVGKKHKF